MQTRRNHIPASFDVAVLMERRPGVTRWQRWSWAPGGLVAGSVAQGSHRVAEEMPAPDGQRRVLWRGYELRLHPDEAESYYHNLMAPVPRAYVVTSGDPSADDGPLPALVTLSFDEANAYAEGEEDVESVPMPPELVQWVEAFVIEHYVPVKRVKRKRKPWVEKR
jgi:hypothetical protein